MLELLNGWLIILFWIILLMVLVAVYVALMYLLGKTICLLVDKLQNEIQNQKKDDAESEE